MLNAISQLTKCVCNENCNGPVCPRFFNSLGHTGILETLESICSLFSDGVHLFFTLLLIRIVQLTSFGLRDHETFLRLFVCRVE